MIKGTAKSRHCSQCREWLGAEYMAEWEEWDHYELQVQTVTGAKLVATNLTKREAWELWKNFKNQSPNTSAKIYNDCGENDPDGGGQGDYRLVWPVEN